MPQIISIQGIIGAVGASVCAHALALYAARYSPRVLLLETAHEGYGVALQRFPQVQATQLPFLHPRAADTATPLTALLPQREGIWLARGNQYLPRSWLTSDFTSVIIDGPYPAADISVWVTDASPLARLAVTQVDDTTPVINTARQPLLLLRTNNTATQVRAHAVCAAALPGNWRRCLTRGRQPRGHAWKRYQQRLGTFLQETQGWEVTAMAPYPDAAASPLTSAFVPRRGKR